MLQNYVVSMYLYRVKSHSIDVQKCPDSLWTIFNKWELPVHGKRKSPTFAVTKRPEPVLLIRAYITMTDERRLQSVKQKDALLLC